MKKVKIVGFLLTILIAMCVINSSVFAAASEQTKAESTNKTETSKTEANKTETNKTSNTMEEICEVIIEGDVWEDGYYYMIPQDAKKLRLAKRKNGEIIEYVTKNDYKSSNESVLTVNNETGEITIKKVGGAWIDADFAIEVVTRKEYDEYVGFQCGEGTLMYNDEPVEGTGLIMDINEKATLSIKKWYKDELNNKDIVLPLTSEDYTFKSNNPDCLEVKEDGTITVKNTGVVKLEIYETSTSGYPATSTTRLLKTYNITINKNGEFDKKEVTITGEKVKLYSGNEGTSAFIQVGTKSQIVEKTAEDQYKKIEYATYNLEAEKDCLEVDENGTIKANKKGFTIINVNQGERRLERFYIEVVDDVQEAYEALTTEQTTIKGDLTELDKTTLDVGFDIKVNMLASAKVESKVFETLKTAKNRKLTIQTENAKWKFESNNIKNTKIGFTPEVKISNAKFDTIKNDNIKNAVFVDFTHSGELPGKATVTLDVGTEKYGNNEKSLYLYYYNPETKGYEYMSEATYNSGKVTFSLEHCSTYALVEKKIEEKTEDKKTNNKVEKKLDKGEQKMGENITGVICAVVLSSLTFAGTVICKKYIK